MSNSGNGWGNGPPGWGPPGSGQAPPPQGGYGAPPQAGAYAPAPQPGYAPQQGYGPPPQMGYGPPPVYGAAPVYAPYGQPGYAPAMGAFGAPLSNVWTCRFCGYQGFPMQIRKISTGGVVVAIVLFVVFFPLFWIGLLMKENVTTCPQCRQRAF